MEVAEDDEEMMMMRRAEKMLGTACHMNLGEF